jgi:hypothetical protein
MCYEAKHLIYKRRYNTQFNEDANFNETESGAKPDKMCPCCQLLCHQLIWVWADLSLYTCFEKKIPILTLFEFGASWVLFDFTCLVFLYERHWFGRDATIHRNTIEVLRWAKFRPLVRLNWIQPIVTAPKRLIILIQSIPKWLLSLLEMQLEI